MKLFMRTCVRRVGRASFSSKLIASGSKEPLELALASGAGDKLDVLSVELLMCAPLEPGNDDESQFIGEAY
jgi:hypothetical protein